MTQEEYSNHTPPKINPANFDKIVNGKQVGVYVLSNSQGIEATFTNYGQRLISLLVPDRDGHFKDIVLGFSSLEKYQKAHERYFGSVIGRYANRIAHGKFSLDDEEYLLAVNNGPNHLHGGPQGFHEVIWEAQQINDQWLEFTRTSPDMEEGYPGKLHAKVSYQLSNDNELKISYEARTDKKTPLNLTHHSFFNLKGEGEGSIEEHVLEINAQYYTPVNEQLIPTGKLANVSGSPFDFTQAKRVGQDLQESNQQLTFGVGYDHNYVLHDSPKNADGLVFAARVSEPESGRVMEVYTNEPGMQFYGGNFLSGQDIGKSGKPYLKREAFCLETQHFPNSPNQPAFPNTILSPGEVFRSHCTYKFSTDT